MNKKVKILLIIILTIFVSSSLCNNNNNSSVTNEYMPEIVTTTDVFEVGYPHDKAIMRLAQLGYEAIDMGFDYCIYEGSPFLDDEYIEWAEKLRVNAEEIGISYTHAHSANYEDHNEAVERSI